MTEARPQAPIAPTKPTTTEREAALLRVLIGGRVPPLPTRGTETRP